MPGSAKKILVKEMRYWKPKVIARVFILLPFDLLIREGDVLPTLETTTPDYKIKFYPPSHAVERTKMTDGVLDPVISLRELHPARFSDSSLVEGRRVGSTNVLILDFSKSEFERAVNSAGQRAPDPELKVVYDIANLILSKLRVYSRAFQIKELVIERDPCYIRYLTDEGNELEEEAGKIRGSFSGCGAVGFPVITPDVLGLIVGPNTAEPYVWDQLLLDAYELLPDVGGAVAMAAAALETFIGWALEILHQERPMSAGLWDWINTRHKDHTKEPSVADKFDILLKAFTSHSLKDDAQLWKYHKELRDARNTLVHKGVAIVGKVPVDSRKARELVNGTDKIVKWVELLLPETYRRARTEAKGPFTRQLSSQPMQAAAMHVANQGQNAIRLLRTGDPVQHEDSRREGTSGADL